MNFSVEEENLICMYHTSDRRRTMARMLAALPDMDTEMRRCQHRNSRTRWPCGCCVRLLIFTLLFYTQLW